MESSDFDVEKIIDCIFDPEISEILAEMENESKQSSVLTEKFEITSEQLQKKLSYLIEHNFVSQSGNTDDMMYSVNSDKLAGVMESSHNYKGIEEGLTKMDSFLN